MEFSIVQTAGQITCNFDELKAELSEKMSVYDGIVISEDTVKLAKDDLANLRKVKKEIEDKRKEAKKIFNAPYEAFEKQVKELVALVDKPIEMIDEQVKDFANRAKAEKEQHVRELYKQEITDKGYEEYLPFASIFNEKWLNKSTEDKEIIFDLNGKLTQVKADLDAIHALQSEFENEIIEAYKSSGNQLTVAIKRNSDLISAKQLAEKKAEEDAQAKIEAERKAREEAEKRAEEAEKKIEEVKEEPINPLPFDVETVRFVISGQENIDRVREFLTFSDIEFEEEVER